MTQALAPSDVPADVRIGKALLELAIARGSALDEATGHVYVRQLEDLDPHLTERACQQLANEPRPAYETSLPSVGIIRARAEALAREDAARESAAKLLPLPKSEDDEPRYFCLECRDEVSGWAFRWCQGGGKLANHDKQAPGDTATVRTKRIYCGRKLIHGPHLYMEKCPCYETNPVIAQKRDALASRRSEATA